MKGVALTLYGFVNIFTTLFNSILSLIPIKKTASKLTLPFDGLRVMNGSTILGEIPTDHEQMITFTLTAETPNMLVFYNGERVEQINYTKACHKWRKRIDSYESNPGTWIDPLDLNNGDVNFSCSFTVDPLTENIKVVIQPDIE